MPPKHFSSLTQQPAQRRPRIDKACTSCKKAKQRCVPSKYDTNDRPCRRCVSRGLDCNLPLVARSQSPGSGLGGQGGPIRYPDIAPHSAGGAARELTPGSETNVQYTLQQSEFVQVPMGRSPPLQTPGFLPAAPSMEGYQQSFPNVAQGFNNPESNYFPQAYYGQITPCDTYMANYATQSASDGAPNLGYTLENPQLDSAGAPVDE